MAKTFNRRPYSVNIPSSSNVQRYNFNQANWSGISDNKNFLATNQETFEDAKNVYVDEFNVLRSRPKLRPVDTIKGFIYDVFSFGSIIVYLVESDDEIFKRKIQIFDNGIESSIYIKSEKVMIKEIDNKLYLFSEFADDKYFYYYDKELKRIDDGALLIYIPKTQATSIDDSADIESKNILTDAEIKTYLYTPGSTVTDSLIGLTVNYVIKSPISIDTLTVTLDGHLHDVLLEYKTLIDETAKNKNGDLLIATSVLGGIAIAYPSLNLIKYSPDGKNFTMSWGITDYDDILEIKFSITGKQLIVITSTNSYYDVNNVLYGITEGFRIISVVKDGNVSGTATYWYDDISKVWWDITREPEYPRRLYVEMYDVQELCLTTYMYYGDEVGDRPVAVLLYDGSDPEHNGYPQTTYTLEKDIEQVIIYGVGFETEIRGDTAPFATAALCYKDLENGYTYVVHFDADFTRQWRGNNFTNCKKILFTKTIDLDVVTTFSYELHFRVLYINNSDKLCSATIDAMTTYPITCLDATKVSYYEDINTPGKLLVKSAIRDDINTLVEVFLYQPSTNHFDEIVLPKYLGNVDYIDLSRYVTIVKSKDNESSAPLYSNYLTDVIELESIPNLNVNKIISDFDVTATLNEYYFSVDNVLYISSYREKDGTFRLYIPEISKQKFNSKILALHPLSESIIGIFTENEVWYVQKSDYGYQYFKSKLNLYLNDKVEPATDRSGASTYILDKNGLLNLSYQNFLATTEQALTYLSEIVNKRFEDGKKHKITVYKNWVICYDGETSVCYFYDIRNNSWWYFDFNTPIEKLTVSTNENFDYELSLLSNGKMYKFSYDKNDYYDLIANNKKVIDWYIKSQKLHFNVINFYKSVEQFTFNLLGDLEYPLSVQLEINNYRDSLNEGKTETMIYDIDTIGTFTKKLSYWRLKEFQYTLKLNDIDAIKVPLELIGITIKYRIGKEIV